MNGGEVHAYHNEVQPFHYFNGIKNQTQRIPKVKRKANCTSKSKRGSLAVKLAVKKRRKVPMSARSPSHALRSFRTYHAGTVEARGHIPRRSVPLVFETAAVGSIGVDSWKLNIPVSMA